MEPVVLQSRQRCSGAALHYTVRRQCHGLLHIQGLEQQVLGSFRVFSRLILKKYLADTIITFVLTSPPSSYQNNTVSVSAQLVTWVCRCPAPTGDTAMFRFNFILLILLKEED